MHLHNSFLLLIPLVCHVAHAQEAPPEEALKYHRALLEHPHNPTIFSRFYDAWIDAKSIESLEAFLIDRANNQPGIHHAILARYQLRRGQDDAALDSLNKAIESLKSDPALLMERANLLLRKLDFELARKDLEAVTKLKNETLSIEATKLIGKSHLREGNLETAIQTWDKILANHPKNEDLLEDLVELASASEQSDQALKYSEQLIAASTDPYKKTLRLIRRGELFYKSGQSDKAITLWSETLTQTGEGSWLEREILAQIEQGFRRLDRLDLLFDKLEELAKTHPRRLLIHRELAKLEAASGNIDSAIGRFREVLRRSPGEPELREEFIRLLINSERFDDASAELGKMLASTPTNPELHLRIAEITHQKAELNPDLDKKVASAEILKSLEKAHTLLDPNEASGLRIANLMLRYGLAKNGEALLKKLSEQPNATTAPAEALVTEYIRKKHPTKALEILKQLATSPDPETVLRATSNMSTLGDPEIPFNILLSRLPDFPNHSSFLSALCQASLAAKKTTEAIPSALKLVRLSKLSPEIRESTKLASTVIAAAEKTEEIITELSHQTQRSNAETCLLASLYEHQNDYEKSDALFANTTEPPLLRFHASLLSIRGDFTAAIASLNRLAETSAGNSASYYKELSDLQLRAGDHEACLATLEQWKIAAPTDKTPWTIAARLQRESGNLKEALETTRRALSHFSQDEELTATLAALYQQTGDITEAEHIFWKLYDQAPDPSSQSRWAARLAELARNSGQTLELKEKFLLRSRSNSQSLGPILALVELARATQDSQATIDHLKHALRIKPKDIDIRLQLASAEQQTGNLENQIAILNDGLAHDSKGRIRTSLAQAYINQGQVIKGLHMLRSLAGERASDPRLIEASAHSIAKTGMLAEAIQYLQESLPDDTDWRARFLLASLLEQDGREAEAIPIFISLLDAETEIPNLIPAQNHNHYIYQQQLSAENKTHDINTIVRAIYQVSQQRQNQQYHSRSQLQLPTSSGEVRLHSIICLAYINSLGSPEFSKIIEAAQIEDLAFITDLTSRHSDGEINYLSLLEKYPDRPGLFQIAIQNGRIQPSDPETLKLIKRFLKSDNLDLNARTLAITILLRGEPENDENWDQLFALAEDFLESDSSHSGTNIYYQIFSLISNNTIVVTPERQEKLKEFLLTYINSDRITEEQRTPLKLSTFAFLKDLDSWIETMNLLVQTHREKLSELLANQQKNSSRVQHSYYYYNGLNIPQIHALPITSLPSQYNYGIAAKRVTHPNNQQVSAEQLLPHLERFESPLLRAWIAIQSGDEKAIKKHLYITPPEIEAEDFAILHIFFDTQEKRFLEACRALLKLSESKSSYPAIEPWSKMCFIATAAHLTKEQQAEFNDPLRKTLKHIEKSLPNGWNGLAIRSTLAEIAKKFSFDDLAKSYAAAPANPSIPTRHANPIKPSGVRISAPAKIAPPRSTTRNSRPVTPIDRFQTFAGEGKTTAAAHELLNWIRTQRTNGNNIPSIIRNLEKSITPEIRNEILTIADPGKSIGITKRLEYAEICDALNEQDQALTTLRELSAERPFDPSISTALAFALPPEEIDTAAKILTKSASSPSLANAINQAYQRISSTSQNPKTFAFFELYAAFLETADPKQLNPRSISQFTSHIYSFCSGNSLRNIPSLISNRDTEKKESPEITKHSEIARRLAFAMLRHPTLAESGFRLIHAIQWIKNPDELDALARTAIQLDTQGSSRNSSSQYIANEHSSATWLCSRILKSSNPNQTLPPEYLADLQETNPKLANLLSSFSSLKSADDINKLWKSGALITDNSNPSLIIIQNTLLSHIATIPGAADFFIDRINAISPEQVKETNPDNGQYVHIPLFRAAIETCKNQNQEFTKKICTAITQAIFGKKIIKEKLEDDDYSQNIIQHIFNNFEPDPVTAAHLIRTFDSLRVPLNQHYWFDNSVRKDRISDPDKAIEFLSSIGLLEDTPTWKPLAVTKSQRIHNQGMLQPTYQIERTYIEEKINNSLDYKLRRPEFITVLENRKPQTFGALITAANLSNGSERNRLAAKAFQHASKYLAKASPNRLQDFSLIIHFLPDDAFSSLPSSLQAKAKELHDKKIAELNDTIEKQFEQIANQPNQNPFYNIQSSLSEMASYDLDQALKIFLRADELHEKNIAYFTLDQTNWHETALSSTLQSFYSNNQGNYERALLFYRALRNSPQSSRFGINDKRSSQSFLAVIGYYLRNRSSSEKIPNWITPWIEISKLPKDLQTDGIAAATCDFLSYSYSFPRGDALLEIDKYKVSPRSREIAIACATIYNWSRETEEARNAAAKSILSILEDSEISAIIRTQVAFAAAAYPDRLLSHPPTAKIISELIVAYCETDHSVVEPIAIRIIENISSMKDIEPVLPYLKEINKAFWKNANSPKPRGHKPIETNQANALFVTAVHLSDKEAIQHLFPHVRSTLIGNIDSIASLILNEQFDLATDLFPDQSSPFTYYRKTNRTPELDEKLNAFCDSLNNPDQALRFRCQLLFLRSQQGKYQTPDEIEKYRQQLIEIYRTNPPKARGAKIEVLGIIATSLNPKMAVFENDITDIAATMDLKNTLHDIVSLENTSNQVGYTAQYEFEIYRQAAMLKFIQGDPSLFINICNEFATLTKTTSPEKTRRLLSNYSSYNNISPYLSFLRSTAQWISLAVAEDKTESFSKMITPLHELAITSASAKQGSTFLNTILSVHDFISHWENQPDDLAEKLKKITNPDMHPTIQRYSFPRKDFPFIYTLEELPTRGGTRQIGSEPVKFLTAILSRPSLSNILVTDYSWIDRLSSRSDDLREKINQLAASPPETFSLAGRTILRFQFATRNYTEKSIEIYRSLIDEAPETHHWDSFRLNCKLNLISKLIQNPQDLVEARELLNPIDPEKIPSHLQSHYKNNLKNLENAEAKHK